MYFFNYLISVLLCSSLNLTVKSCDSQVFCKYWLHNFLPYYYFYCLSISFFMRKLLFIGFLFILILFEFTFCYFNIWFICLPCGSRSLCTINWVYPLFSQCSHSSNTCSQHTVTFIVEAIFIYTEFYLLLFFKTKDFKIVFFLKK